MSSATPLRVSDAPVQKLLRATFDQLEPLAQATALEVAVRNHRDGCADIQLFGNEPDDQTVRTRSRQSNEPSEARAVSLAYWLHGAIPDNTCHEHKTIAQLCVKEVTASVLQSGLISSTTEETSMSLLRTLDGPRPGEGLLVVERRSLGIYLPHPLNQHRIDTSESITKKQLSITILDELEQFLEKFATIAREAMA